MTATVPTPDPADEGNGLAANPDVARYPDRTLIGLARNIVNQILDESGADVPTRQSINDRCDEFTHRLLAAAVRAASEKAWDEGWCAGASNVFAMKGEKPLPQGSPYRPNESTCAIDGTPKSECSLGRCQPECQPARADTIATTEGES